MLIEEALAQIRNRPDLCMAHEADVACEMFLAWSFMFLGGWQMLENQIQRNDDGSMKRVRSHPTSHTFFRTDDFASDQWKIFELPPMREK